jgi:hypothetical protein
MHRIDAAYFCQIRRKRSKHITAFATLPLAKDTGVHKQ